MEDGTINCCLSCSGTLPNGDRKNLCKRCSITKEFRECEKCGIQRVTSKYQKYKWCQKCSRRKTYNFRCEKCKQEFVANSFNERHCRTCREELKRVICEDCGKVRIYRRVANALMAKVCVGCNMKRGESRLEMMKNDKVKKRCQVCCRSFTTIFSKSPRRYCEPCKHKFKFCIKCGRELSRIKRHKRLCYSCKAIEMTAPSKKKKTICFNCGRGMLKTGLRKIFCDDCAVTRRSWDERMRKRYSDEREKLKSKGVSLYGLKPSDFKKMLKKDRKKKEGVLL